MDKNVKKIIKNPFPQENRHPGESRGPSSCAKATEDKGLLARRSIWAEAGIPGQARDDEEADYFIGKFQAMGCPCEVLLDTQDESIAHELTKIAAEEAWRIENKYSRYQTGNIIFEINNSHGLPVVVDEETAKLIDFAEHCYQMSDGLFDITSGTLRKVWTFDGKAQTPDTQKINQVLQFVGWKKIKWNRPMIQIPAGMEIDLGGIGKEYAVDRALQLMRDKHDVAVLVNFGGDIAAGGIRKNGQPWMVGIESHKNPGQAERIIQLGQGAVATSGDTKKFIMINGVRHGHILNPRSGWPFKNSHRSVTATAKTCTEAGFLSTLAILKGGSENEI